MKQQVCRKQNTRRQQILNEGSPHDRERYKVQRKHNALDIAGLRNDGLRRTRQALCQKGMQIKPRKQVECNVATCVTKEILADRLVDVTKHKVINGQHAARQRQGPKQTRARASVTAA